MRCLDATSSVQRLARNRITAVLDDDGCLSRASELDDVPLVLRVLRVPEREAGAAQPDHADLSSAAGALQLLGVHENVTK